MSSLAKVTDEQIAQGERDYARALDGARFHLEHATSDEERAKAAERIETYEDVLLLFAEIKRLRAR